MIISKNKMSVDPEGIGDDPQNSIFTWVALLLGILGLFAIIAPLLSIFCLASVVCGLTVLLFASRWNLSRLSTGIATVCIFAGLFCGLAGITYRMTKNWLIDRKGIEVASQYVEALALGDKTTAIKMTGLPPLVVDEEEGKMSREQKAVRAFLADPAIQEILAHGASAKWRSTGISARERTGNLIDLSVSFIDEQSTNPRPVTVTVKMIPPTQHTIETRNQWLVQAVSLAPL